MPFWDNLRALFAGRRRHVPERSTDVFPRALGANPHAWGRRQPLFRPTPPTLRFFSHTPHARRAINTIKNPIAQLDWEIVPIEDAKPSRELLAQCELVEECFENPNNDDSFRTLIEQVIEDLLVAGAGVIEQQIGGDMVRPLWLYPVDAQSIQIYPLWQGGRNEARYLQTIGYGNYGGATGIHLRNDEIIYIRPNPNTASPYGVSPLEIAFNTVSRMLGVAEYAGNVTSNAQPENLITAMGYDADKMRAFQQYWRNEIEGQGQTPMIGVPEKDAVNVLKLRGADDRALYLEYQEFLIRTLAAAFDISPQNLGVEADVNRNTSETAEDRDWDHAIKPYASLIEAHLNRETIHGLLGFSQIEFRFVGIDRDDEKATAEIFELYYENNVLTPNEQREKLGLQPSDSEWADLNYADVQLAIAEKRGPNDPAPVDPNGPAGKAPAPKKAKQDASADLPPININLGGITVEAKLPAKKTTKTLQGKRLPNGEMFAQITEESSGIAASDPE
jgi:HK97 family phage portal protein